MMVSDPEFFSGEACMELFWWMALGKVGKPLVAPVSSVSLQLTLCALSGVGVRVTALSLAYGIQLTTNTSTSSN